MKKAVLSLIIGSLCFTNLFAADYSIFQYNGKQGFIDKKLNVLLFPEYDNIYFQDNGYICYKKTSDWWEISAYNSELKKVYYTNPGSFLKRVSEYEYRFDDDDDDRFHESMLNMKTGEISPYVPDKNFGTLQNPFIEDRALVWIDKSYSIVDKAGNIIVDGIEDANSAFSEGLLAVVFQDSRSGFIDRNGNLVIQTPFYIAPDWIGPRKEAILTSYFKDGVSIVWQNKDTWKLIDKNGNIKNIPDRIKIESYCFSNSLCAISKQENGLKKYGFMNKNLEIEIPCVFDEASNFVGDYAMVVYKGQDGLIDKKGNFYLSADLVNGIKKIRQ